MLTATQNVTFGKKQKDEQCRHHVHILPVLAALVVAMLFGSLTGRFASAADFGVFGSAIIPPPTQTLLAAGNQFSFHGATLTKVASYAVTGRVLSGHRYYYGREADTSPVDLALGWGWMADESTVGRLNFNQDNRRLFYQSKKLSGLTTEEIAASSSNNHIIPANDEIADAIEDLRPGEIVTLYGVLVNVSYPDGWRWDTSLSRADTGDGACEIIYVTQMIVRTAPQS